MKEYRTVKMNVEKQVLHKVTCNKCGNSSLENEQSWNQNYQTFQTSFGYGSDYDSESWGFDLCEDCLTELVKTFEYAPDGFGESGYHVEYPQAVFEQWKETGIVDLEAGMTAEEIEVRGGSIYQDCEEENEE